MDEFTAAELQWLQHALSIAEPVTFVMLARTASHLTAKRNLWRWLSLYFWSGLYVRVNCLHMQTRDQIIRRTQRV